MKSLKPSKSDVKKKQERLHKWDNFVGIVQWLIEHQVPQVIIKLTMWIVDFFFKL